MALLKYGRSIRVFLQLGVGAIVPIVMWQEGRPVGPKVSLSTTFVVRRQSGPHPHECSLSIWGLSRATRELLVKTYETAEEMAFKTREALQVGKIRVDVGYGLDVATLFTGDIAADGVRTEFARPGHVVHLRALDGRLAWKGKFINRTTSTNIDLNTVRGMFAAGGSYMAGLDADAAFAKQFPTLIKKKQGFPGYESGYSIFGESRAQNAQICKDLGIIPYFRDGEVVYIPADAASLDLAVVLTAAGNGVLLDAQSLGLGKFRVRTLMEHRLRIGRQVIVSDELGRPIGGSGGLFRVDGMVATGGNRSADFNVEADLYPTGLSL